MARSLSSILVAAQLQATLNNSLDTNNASVNQGDSFSPDTAPANGTSADQADRIWSDPSRTLTGASSETFDLFDFAGANIGAGAALDALGQAAALTEVCGILIENSIDSTGNLLVGGDGTTACWNSLFNGDDDALIIIPPGGCFFYYNRSNPALAVADTSNHLLKIASSATLTYSITLMGRSA